MNVAFLLRAFTNRTQFRCRQLGLRIRLPEKQTPAALEKHPFGLLISPSA